MDGLVAIEEACLVGRMDNLTDPQEKMNELIRAHNKLVVLYSQRYNLTEESSERHNEA